MNSICCEFYIVKLGVEVQGSGTLSGMFSIPCAFLAAVVAQAPAPSFDYDRSRPLGIDGAAANAAGVTVRDITYLRLDGTRNAATLVTPSVTTNGPHPAILFVHWYEPPKPSSNRTEFL